MNKDIRMNVNPYDGLKAVLCLLLFAVFGAQEVIGQDVLETRWYFGNTADNLVFDRNGRDVYLESNQATPFGTGGAVTITDQFTGNLLFYTDGTQVFDASHNLVPNATALIADPSINVPVVTVPVFGNMGEYYLFTNQGTVGSEILVSVVDANLQGNGTAQFPLGDLASANTNTGLTDPSEAMLVIPVGDGENYWLLSQDQTNFEIRVTPILEGAIDVTQNYDLTTPEAPGFLISQFAFNQDSLWLALAPQAANRNVWILDFDPDSGVPVFREQLLGTGFDDGAGESIYDVEWSNDGSKLYLSRFGGPGDLANLYQWNFSDTTFNEVLPNPINRSYGLKRAIDGRIYHLYQETNTSAFELGRINRPDSLIDSVQYVTAVIGGDFNALQFPEFTPAYDFQFDTLNFYWIDSCTENVTKFFPIVEPVPDNFFWQFDAAGGSPAILPNVAFPAAGGYMVSLTASIAGIDTTITIPVEILENDLMVDLGNDTTICVDEVLPLDAGMGQSFVWNTGDTTQVLQVDTAGTYWVEVTSTTGCTSYDEIEVTEYGVSNQTSNQWYFGEQAGIEFTGGAQAILDANNQMAAEGCATISDVNGDLLFYTNGVTIWNRDHEVMQNGEEIGGDQEAAQSSLILPYGDDMTLFYVFTTESVYGDGEYALRYTVVDMKGDQGLGEVVIKNIQLMDNSTERITASGFSGNDVLLTHEFGNNMFRSYFTNAGGLFGAVFSPVGEVHQFVDELSATGYMKFSPTLDLVAVNIPGTSEVEILDYDQFTGALSNPRLIDTGEANLYGLEFSNAGTKLYLTTSGAGASKLIQYDLDSLNSMDPAADISATKFDGYPQGAGYGALQTGPDGVIYMAVDNSGTIGTINNSEGDDDAASFNASGFDLQGRTSRLGLPNFAQNQSPPLQEPSLTVTVGCAGQESTFNGVGRDNSIEEYLWIFGDGQSSIDQATTHTYDSAGIYTVQLQLSNRCDVDTILTQQIEVFSIPEVPTVPSDTTLCDQPIVLTAWPVDNPELSYFWSTGETTREISIASPTVVDVAIINTVTGCSSDTLQVFVANAGPTIDLGSDLLLCQNDNAVTLDSQVPNGTYEWAIDGVVSGTNRTFDVVTSNAGVFEYTVAVTNSFGCIGRDTVSVIILEEPDITVTTDPTSNCGLTDGDITIQFNSTGSYTYQVSGPVNVGPVSVDGPTTIALVDQFSGGNYTVQVTNIVTGCSIFVIAQVEDPASFGLTTSSMGECEGEVELTLDFGTVPASYTYLIQDDQGATISSGTDSVDPLVLSNLNPGVFNIQVTDNGSGCIETNQLTVVEGAQPTVTFDAIQEICGAEGTISVNAGGIAPGVTWTGPGIVGSNTGESITVNSPGDYIFSASNGAGCPAIDTVEVIFNNDPIVDISITGDPCEGELVLLADVSNGSGTYVFDWSNGGQAQQNTVTISGAYSVTVVDQFTGCSVTSAPVDVTVESIFEVLLTADCDAVGNVLLIATTNYFDPSITYQWRNEAGELIPVADSILSTNLSGRYSVIATNETGTCMVTDEIDVAVVPIDDGDLLLPSRATFCSVDPSNPQVDLDPGTFNSYEWRLLPDQAVISTDPVLTVATEGLYEVELFNGFTCRTVQVNVVEDCRPVVFAPNAFSPNGNDVNEEFFVFPNDFVDEFEIFIYTRWGELVFYSDTADFRWDGFYRGSLLPVGTYAYILKFSSLLEPELGTIEQYGSVTLIR